MINIKYIYIFIKQKECFKINIKRKRAFISLTCFQSFLLIEIKLNWQKNKNKINQETFLTNNKK